MLQRLRAWALPRAPGPGTRLRRWSVLLLVVLSSTGVLVSAVAVWSHSLVFNTDRWVTTVGPVARDPQVTHDLSVYVTDRAVEAAGLEARVADALPPRASFLAPAITAAARDLVQRRMEERLNQPRTYELWLKLNRFAHRHLVAVLNGDATYVRLNGDEVQLNLVPLVAQALALLEQVLPGALGERVAVPRVDPDADAAEMRARLTAATGRPLPDDFGTVVLFKGEQVAQVQRAVRVFRATVVGVLVVTALLVAAALVFSRRRLRTLVQLGLGTLLGVALARVVVQRLTDAVLDGLRGEAGFSIARALVEAAVGDLRGLLVWLLVAGALVAVAAYLTGQREWLDVARRRALAAAGTAGGVAASSSPLRQWLGRHYDGLRAGGLVAAVAALFFTTGSWWLTLAVLALTAAYEFAVWRLAEPAAS